jgi:hypothetical protein
MIHTLDKIYLKKKQNELNDQILDVQYCYMLNQTRKATINQNLKKLLK